MRNYRYPQWSELMQKYLSLAECVVEGECVVFDILCDPINFVFRLMDFYLGIRAADRIDFSVLLLLLEDGPLPDTDG